MSVVPLSPEDASRPSSAEEPLDPFFKWGDGRINGMFECKPQPAVWFAKNRLLAGRGHILSGVGGSSKTRALYHLGIGAPLGTLPWAWTIEKTGSAALFLAEDTIDDMHRVLHAIGQQYSEEQRRQLVRMLRVFPLAGYPFRLLCASGQSLVEGPAFDWMMERIGLLPKPVAFIGIDPALGVTEGDEMNQAHQRRLGELVDRIAIETGACVVLTTHAAKSLHQAEELGSHSSRGGGAITDAVRGEFTLRTMTAEEARKFGVQDRAERQRYVQLAATKGNSLPPEAYEPVWLRRGHGGMLSEVSLAQVERGTVGQRELQALEILKRACESGDTSMKFWRAQCVAASVIKSGSESGQEKALERIRGALLDAGLITNGSSRGLWIPT